MKNLQEVFLKRILVEYLLDRSLNPALDNLFRKDFKLDDVNRTEQLFDFRVADIAMGSGHFLVLHLIN